MNNCMLRLHSYKPCRRSKLLWTTACCAYTPTSGTSAATYYEQLHAALTLLQALQAQQVVALTGSPHSVRFSRCCRNWEPRSTRRLRTPGKTPSCWQPQWLQARKTSTAATRLPKSVSEFRSPVTYLFWFVNPKTISTSQSSLTNQKPTGISKWCLCPESIPLQSILAFFGWFLWIIKCFGLGRSFLDYGDRACFWKFVWIMPDLEASRLCQAKIFWKFVQEWTNV